MTPALLDPPRRGPVGGGASVLSSGGRPTLEERLDRCWRALRAEGTGDCPVCGGRILPRAACGGGRCGDCESTLS
jgi:hypothetical protein